MANGVIVIGGAVNDNVSVNLPSGVVRGYDAATGELLWAFDSGDPDLTVPLGPDETYTENSPNVWAPSEGRGPIRRGRRSFFSEREDRFRGLKRRHVAAMKSRWRRPIPLCGLIKRRKGLRGLTAPTSRSDPSFHSWTSPRRAAA